IIEKYLKAIENKSIDQLREIIHPEYYITERRVETRKLQQIAMRDITSPDHGNSVSQKKVIGIEGFIKSIGWSLSNLEFKIQKIRESNNEVWVDMDISGLHTGHVFGVPPTGEFISYRAIFFYVFRDHKIIEYDGLYDQLAFLGHIGKAVLKTKDSIKIDLYMSHLENLGLISN
ncbi:MAG: ester cyclase, partial [Candidatus Kariarchaeaceae archaeon]